MTAGRSDTPDLLGTAEYDSAGYMAAMVENSDDAIVSKDLGGKILSWNDAATALYGYTADQAIGQQVDIVIADDDDHRQEELNIRARIARGERIQHYETIRRRKDGTHFEVSMSISPVRDATGRIVAAAGFARDISERRVFQAAQYLAAIVENSDDAIESEDLDGKILSWNDAATALYGYTADQAIGQQIDIVIADDDDHRQEELNIRARIARGERIQHHETLRRGRDGSLLEMSLSISPVRDATGRIVAAAGFARDISERRRLEDERKRTTGLLKRFADFSAHDFKTPMQHILWDSQAAAKLLGMDAPAEVRELLSRIVASSRWMQRRTDGLRVASGITQGVSPARQLVQSEKAFDEAHGMLGAVDQFVKEATITRDALPQVVSNDVLLGFLFQNLLQNSCKYGRVNVPVTVHASAKRVAEAWEFSIRDNGRGIAPTRINSIFEPYVRGDNVGSDEPGSGIGLNFCRTIIEWHKGRIWAESGPGPGSTLKFTIPHTLAGRQ